MKKFLTLVLALAMSVPALAHAPKSLDATHRIEMQMDKVNPYSGKKESAICSATAVGPHALLTAAHCDTGDNVLTLDGAETVVIADRIKDGADHEIFIVAFLNPKEKFENVAQFERTDAIQKGDDIWVEGNPAGWPQLVRRGVYAGNMEVDGKVCELYDFNGFFGDSGSAIFDEHGKIVAVTNVYVSSGNVFGTFKLMGSWPLHFSPEQLKQAQE